jgi:hypothetical protein
MAFAPVRAETRQPPAYYKNLSGGMPRDHSYLTRIGFKPERH